MSGAAKSPPCSSDQAREGFMPEGEMRTVKSLLSSPSSGGGEEWENKQHLLLKKVLWNMN